MAKKRSVESSQLEQLVRRSDADIRRYIKSEKFKTDSARLRKHLRENGGERSAEGLKAIPELTDKELSLFRPVKASIAVRVDADVLACLAESQRRTVSAHLNATWRAAMLAERKR
jgi:hypothetical protein